MQIKGEVNVYWDRLPNGKKILRISAKNISEDLKNELTKILSNKGECLKVVTECNSKLSTYQK